MFWIHHEAEELRVHHRTTILPEEARALVVTLLASGQVPPLQATLVDIEPTTARPVLQRFWGTACRRAETVYFILFINDRCLVLAPFGMAHCMFMQNGRNRGRDQTNGGQQ